MLSATRFTNFHIYTIVCLCVIVNGLKCGKYKVILIYLLTTYASVSVVNICSKASQKSFYLAACILPFFSEKSQLYHSKSEKVSQS